MVSFAFAAQGNVMEHRGDPASARRRLGLWSSGCQSTSGRLSVHIRCRKLSSGGSATAVSCGMYGLNVIVNLSIIITDGNNRERNTKTRWSPSI